MREPPVFGRGHRAGPALPQTGLLVVSDFPGLPAFLPIYVPFLTTENTMKIGE